MKRRIVLELSDFLGSGAIIQSTDLLVTLPRYIGRTLADTYGLQVLACPAPIEAFTVHARYHQNTGNRWLRSVLV